MFQRKHFKKIWIEQNIVHQETAFGNVAFFEQPYLLVALGINSLVLVRLPVVMRDIQLPCGNTLSWDMPTQDITILMESFHIIQIWSCKIFIDHQHQWNDLTDFQYIYILHYSDNTIVLRHLKSLASQLVDTPHIGSTTQKACHHVNMMLNTMAWL